MAKPTESTEWSSDAGSLKTTTTANQKTHGWNTSDGTATGVPPRPNLQNQNYWQYAVHQWVEWFSAELPDDDFTIVDLWRWDICDTSGGKSGNYLDGFRESSGIAGALEMHYADGAYGYDWVSDKGDALMASRYWELLDMFSRGIGFQIIDASDVVWTVYPTGNWTNFNTPTNNGINWVNLVANLSGGPGGPSYVELDPAAWVGNEFFTIRKDDAGVITNPADFSGFTAITHANFATYNPNGVRAVLVGNANNSHEYTTGEGKRVSVKDLKPRWIRTWQSSDHTIVPEDNATAGEFDTRIPVSKGKTYKVRVTGRPQTTLANGTYSLQVGTYYVYADIGKTHGLTAYQRKYYNANLNTADYNFHFDVTVAGPATTDYMLFTGLNGSQGQAVTGTGRLVQQDLAKIIVEEI